MTQMRALVYDEPAPDTSGTRTTHLDIPSPGPGEVLIEVDYAGVNFKDVMVRRGDPGYVNAWPMVPGLEVAGTIAAVGEGVTGPGVGARVAALTNEGGFAEYAVADARLTCVVPPQVPLEYAAAAPAALATAHLLVNTIARVAPGDVLAVHSAAGAVGQTIAQLAEAMKDVTLVGFVGAPARAGLAEQLGYEHVFVRGPSMVEDVRTRLGDQPVGVILDSQGTRWLEQDLEMLRPGGRIVLFGNAAGDSFEALPPATTLMRKNATIGGFSLAGFSMTAPDRMRETIELTIARLADGTIRPSIVLEQGLDAVPALQERLSTGEGGGRKYVVRIGQD